MSAITELAGTPGSSARDTRMPDADQRERFERALAGRDETLPQLRPQRAERAVREGAISGEGAAESLDEADAASHAPAQREVAPRHGAIPSRDGASGDEAGALVEAVELGMSAPALPSAAALPMTATAAPLAAASAPAPVDTGGASVGSAAITEALTVSDAAPAPGDSMAAAAADTQRTAASVAAEADARAFAALVDQARGARHAAGDGSLPGDAAAAAMVLGRGELPTQLPSAIPATASPTPADAARLAEWLLRHNPMVVTGDEAVRMSFPPGSGPIEQIVFSRDAGALSVLVSSVAGTREVVQRSLGDLERRLRERGLAVAGVRMADGPPAGASAAPGAESAGTDARY